MTREEQLEIVVDTLQRELLNAAAKEIRYGDAYRHQFFLPESLGFREEELLDPDLEREGAYSVMGSIYIKDGYAIARGDDNYWIISCPSKQIKNKLIFNNMFEAVVGLQMSGMTISFEEIRREASKVVEGITDMIEEELPKIRAERKMNLQLPESTEE
jgi:hypothetical protein